MLHDQIVDSALKTPELIFSKDKLWRGTCRKNIDSNADE